MILTFDRQDPMPASVFRAGDPRVLGYALSCQLEWAWSSNEKCHTVENFCRPRLIYFCNWTSIHSSVLHHRLYTPLYIIYGAAPRLAVVS